MVDDVLVVGEVVGACVTVCVGVGADARTGVRHRLESWIAWTDEDVRATGIRPSLDAGLPGPTRMSTESNRDKT